VSGTVVTADGTSQVVAANSTDRVIGAVARAVNARGGWASTAGQVVTIDVPSLGLFWFQHLNLTDQYGLMWHVAVAQVVNVVTILGTWDGQERERESCCRTLRDYFVSSGLHHNCPR
jgi:hypothetical protein